MSLDEEIVRLITQLGELDPSLLVALKNTRGNFISDEKKYIHVAIDARTLDDFEVFDKHRPQITARLEELHKKKVIFGITYCNNIQTCGAKCSGCKFYPKTYDQHDEEQIYLHYLLVKDSRSVSNVSSTWE